MQIRRRYTPRKPFQIGLEVEAWCLIGNREWIEDPLRNDRVAPMPFSTRRDTGTYNDALWRAFSVYVPVRTIECTSGSVRWGSCSLNKQHLCFRIANGPGRVPSMPQHSAPQAQCFFYPLAFPSDSVQEDSNSGVLISA